MVVAMIPVRMMQDAIHEIVDVIAMRNSFMTAARAMNMGATLSVRRATDRVVCRDFNDVFIHMTFVGMMQVTIVKVVYMVVVANRCMSAGWSVNMRMILVDFTRLVHGRSLVRKSLESRAFDASTHPPWNLLSSKTLICWSSIMVAPRPD